MYLKNLNTSNVKVKPVKIISKLKISENLNTSNVKVKLM